jgi:hypothetical protein
MIPINIYLFYKDDIPNYYIEAKEEYNGKIVEYNSIKYKYRFIEYHSSEIDEFHCKIYSYPSIKLFLYTDTFILGIHKNKEDLISSIEQAIDYIK